MPIKQKILSHIEKFEHVIWDWNGTLFDDVEVAVASMNDLLLEYQLRALSLAEYRKTFKFPVRHFYEELGFNFEKISFAEICNQFMTNYDRHHHSKGSLFTGVPEILSELKLTKTQSILSAAEQNHLNAMTDHFHISKYFHHRFGIEDNQAASKVYRGHQLIAESKVAKERTIMIGDTIHDFEVAKELGIQCLLIADGHQETERLKDLSVSIVSGRRKF